MFCLIPMNMGFIHDRMKQLGMEFADLNRQFCEVKKLSSDNPDLTPMQTRRMLYAAVEKDYADAHRGQNPTLKNLALIIKALDGELFYQSGSRLAPLNPNPEIETLTLRELRGIAQLFGNKIVVKWDGEKAREIS